MEFTLANPVPSSRPVQLFPHYPYHNDGQVHSSELKREVATRQNLAVLFSETAASTFEYLRHQMENLLGVSPFPLFEQGQYPKSGSC